MSRRTLVVGRTYYQGISVTLHPDTARCLREAADRMHKTMSEIVDEAVREKLRLPTPSEDH